MLIANIFPAAINKRNHIDIILASTSKKINRVSSFISKLIHVRRQEKKNGRPSKIFIRRLVHVEITPVAPDKQVSLKIKLIEATLQLNRSLFFAPWPGHYCFN